MLALSSATRKQSLVGIVGSKRSRTLLSLVDSRFSPPPVRVNPLVHFSPQRQDHDDDQKSLHQQRLYHTALPRIQLGLGGNVMGFQNNNTNRHLFPQQLVRGIVTTSATTSSTVTATAKAPYKISPSNEFHSTHQVHSASLSSSSSSSSSSPSSSSSSDQQEDKLTWGERYKEGTASVRARAQHLREGAKASFTEFREHPGQSVSSGAKSFTGMVRAYGPMFAVVHVTLYFATISALFVGVDSGVLDPVYLMSHVGSATADGVATETKNTVDLVVEWMQHHTWTESMAPVIERNPHFASFAVAWIAVKFTEPLRLPISLFLTPRLARYFGWRPKKLDGGEGGDAATDSSKSNSSSSDGEKSNESTKSSYPSASGKE
ncbi:hypothetical protein ACA910_013373 [Epithemia clementina (nom. ined.)]